MLKNIYYWTNSKPKLLQAVSGRHNVITDSEYSFTAEKNQQKTKTLIIYNIVD